MRTKPTAPPIARRLAPKQNETATGQLFLDFLGRIQPSIQSYLERALSSEIKAVQALGPETASACRAFSDVCLRGGKRLRAALVVTGGEYIGKRSDPQLLVTLGAAVEVLHGYFLVHDDWMDNDMVRRGGPSAHAALRKHHGEHIGDAAAVLAGDWGAAIANDWVAQSGVATRKLPTVLRTFAAMQRAAIGGQLRDILATDEQVELTYRLKTASYTVEGPLALGAIACGASEKHLETIRRFATPAGVAFQLRDDLIGLFGSARKTGKPFGSDLRAGKRTSVALHALSAARGADARAIRKAFGNPKATASELRAAVAAIDHAGSREHVEKQIERLTAQACRELAKPWITEAARALLTSAAFALAVRSQ